MNKDTLAEAITEAERFIKLAKTALAAVKEEDAVLAQPGHVVNWPRLVSVKRAAAKRASMDLTRALARMRKP